MSHKIVQKTTQYETYLEISDEKTLITANGLDFTLPGKPIERLHYHTLYEIGICKSGNGLWCTPDYVQAISAGDAVLIPPEYPHYSRSIDKCICEFIFFDIKKLLNDCGIDMSDILEMKAFDYPIILKNRNSRKLCRLLSSMVKVASDKANPNRYRTAAHWFSLFILEYLKTDSVKTPNTESRLFPAIEKIVGGFSLVISLDELTEACNMSTNWFLKAFKSEFGTTPIKYLNNYRVDIASQLLLETDKPISEIATVCGYNSPSDLYRHFKAKFKMSPNEYRVKHLI